jgi:ferrous iron transport protein A
VISVETESQFGLFWARFMPPAPENICPQRLSLVELPAGVPSRVTGLNGQPEFSQRLREMGFCESAVIQKIAGKQMVICELCGTRVALSDRVAGDIEVEPIRGDA